MGAKGENGLDGCWVSNQRGMISVKRRMHISLLMTKWIGLDFSNFSGLDGIGGNEDT